MREMKDSGIEWLGNIPSSWNIKKARWLFRERNEKGNPVTVQLLTPSQKYGVLPQDIYREVSGSKPVQVSENKDLSDFKTVHKGDFCISLSAYMGGFEYSEYEGVISPAYHSFFSISDEVNEKYYKYLFKTSVFIDVINLITPNSVRVGRNTSFDSFKEVLLPVPEIHEQERIVDYLDKKCVLIDSIIEKQQKIIVKLNEYKLSVVTEAVTNGLSPDVEMKSSGVDWVGKIPISWEIHKFSWDYSAMLGKMLDAKKIKGNKLHPYIKNVDVQWDKINFDNLDEMDFDDSEVERYLIRPGDLMICEGGEIGKCAIVPENAPDGIFYQKALHRVRAREKNNGYIRYLYYVIFSMAKNNCLNTSPEKATISHLPGDALSQLRMPFPAQTEQIRIADYLDERCSFVDGKISNIEKLVDRLQEYKKSLIYEVVTGKREV